MGKVSERKFLGHRLLEGGTLGVAPQSRERLRDSLKELTRRSAGRSFESVIHSVNQKLTGWIQYFRMARMKSVLEDTPQAHRGMSLSWFKQIGLIVPEEFYLTLQRAC